MEYVAGAEQKWKIHQVAEGDNITAWRALLSLRVSGKATFLFVAMLFAATTL
jgi:hypothetical protein